MPDILYKYRPWSESRDKHCRDILKHGYVFFSSPASFNDPFDCGIPFRYDLLGKDELLKQLFYSIRQNEPEIDRAEALGQAALRAKNIDFKDPKTFDDYRRRLQELRGVSFGLLCLSEKNDNILLWSHYADSHRGICIGLNVSKLEEKFQSMMGSDGWPIYLNRVDYQLDYPVFRPDVPKDVTLTTQVCTKSSLWHYEQEWRFVIVGRTALPIYLPRGAVSEIIIGCRVDEEDRRQIIEIARSHPDKPKVLQTKESIDKFELDIMPIE